MIWTDTEEELLKFINEFNQKHKTIKFDFKYSKTKIEFLDVLVYKDINNKLQRTLYKKLTDRQRYLHANSEHPRSLKDLCVKYVSKEFAPQIPNLKPILIQFKINL